MTISTWFSRLAFWRTPAPAKVPRRYPRRSCLGCDHYFAVRQSDNKLFHHSELECMERAREARIAEALEGQP
jgi:hypothetical protein